MIPIFIFVMAVNAKSAVGVAPGDEEQLCRDLRADGVTSIPAYSANMKVLMDSWNYQNLLPPRIGAVWDQVDNDENNPIEISTNVSLLYMHVNAWSTLQKKVLTCDM